MSLRSWRLPLAALTVLLLGTLLTALALGGNTGGTLDPDSASADGSRALATLLQDRGLTVTTARTTADAVTAVHNATTDVTLLVADPALLSGSQLETLAATPVARLVLVQPDSVSARTLTSSADGVQAAARDRTLLDPGCSDPDASAAGNADIGDGAAFTGGSGCYASADGYALMSASGPASADTVLVGSRTPFRNDKLADHGNAALTLRLLGKHPTVVWYLPDSADPGAAPPEGRKGFTEVLPAGWRWGALMLGIAVLLLALWQARRLGPVVAERLPVVVRAAETVEGRARLYERGKVADRAAGALREASRARLARRLGLPASAPPGEIAAAVAGRGGPGELEVLGVLAGPAPADDAQLVGLAAALDRLEAEVGRL